MTPPLPTRRWLKPDEAAEYLGVSRAGFDVLARKGVFAPSHAAGPSSPRYDVRHLDAAMEAHHGNSSDTQRQAG